MRFFLSLFLFSAIGFSSALFAGATVFEKLVMPGKVIEAHKKYESKCKNCHESFKSDQSLLCLDCHKKVAEDVNKKKGFHGRSKIVKNRLCKNCHTDHIGRDADVVGLDKGTFNHNITDFKLKGQHKQTKCSECHKKDKKFREAVSKCYSCHKKDDVHKKKLGKKCHQCHSEVSWNKMKFDHDKTDFPLKYEHEKASCDGCHPDNKHKDTPKNCYACHAINDVHKRRYGKKCKTCHSEKGWDKAFFNHNKKTKFKIKGKHKKVECDSCHTVRLGKIYKNKPKKYCYSCHKADDVHRGRNGKKCQKCHAENSWKKNKFNHNKDTDFKIKGKHKKIKCSACHPSGKVKRNNKKVKTRTCYSCHRLDDEHRGEQGKRCDKCHTEKNWSNVSGFNHDIMQFPLLGQHAILSCDECHLDRVFKEAKKHCFACHKKDDSHKKTMGEKCENCHNPNGWRFWRFEHNSQTNFKLEGSHKNLQCIACHKVEMKEYVEQSPTCSVCHYQDDIHSGDFGNQCDQCHNTKKFNQNTLLD